MSEPDSPPAARVHAASVLLDRGWGKPHQESTVNIQRTTAREKTDVELAEILAGADRGSEGNDPAPIDPARLN